MSIVLVTGANGFVGRVVCARLAEAGYTAVAGLRNRQQWPIMREAVPAIRSYRILGDLRSPVDQQDALEGIDTVVHLAGRVHVMRESASDLLEEFRASNVVGTRRLALAASEDNVRRFVFVSTAKVNGETTEDVPFSESDSCNPRDHYALSKYEAEKELRCIGERTGMEVVIVRPPLVYGPGVRANFLRLLWVANLAMPLPIPDTGNRRSLVGVQNLADFLVQCVSHKGAANQTFLISDGEDISTRDLIAKLGQALGRKTHFLPFPAAGMRMAGKLLGREDEVSRLLDSLSIDSTKARSLLGWVPPVTLSAGLEATAQWYCRR